MVERLSGCLQHGLCEFEIPVQMRGRWQGTKRPYATLLEGWSVLWRVVAVNEACFV